MNWHDYSTRRWCRSESAPLGCVSAVGRRSGKTEGGLGQPRCPLECRRHQPVASNINLTWGSLLIQIDVCDTVLAMRRFSQISKLTAVVASIVMVLVTFTPAAEAGGKNLPPKRKGMVYTESSQRFEETWSAITTAIEANPNLNMVFTVDHAEAAASVGLDLRPNRVVVFGNPNIGTPLVAANQTVGIDLPQKLHVIERNGKVFVGFNDATFLAARHSLEGAHQLEIIAEVLRNLTTAGTGPDAPYRTRGADSFERNDRLKTVKSNADFETTWNRLVGTIDASPANLFATVDHQANASNAGLELRPTRLAVFGNPNIGTPLMQDSPTAGIDLPLKILVWEDAHGDVMVTTNRVNIFKNKHKVRDTDLDGIRTALNNFLDSSAQPSTR